MNEEFKVKLTPKDDSPAYSQSLPAPINLKEDILFELALLHKYGRITTLPFSNCASQQTPIAQKKSNRKFRLLVDLRKINNLLSDNYINTNHSCQFSSRNRPTHGRQKDVSQIRLFPSISLPANG